MKRSNRKRAGKQGQQRKLQLEPLEQRVCLAASLGWDGPGLGAASLSYYIGNVPASVGLEQAEVEAALETALGAWSQVADVTFTQTTLPRQSDSLDITFTSLDGSGGILAQAYLPDDVNRGRLAGDIEFDLAEPWEIGNSGGSSAFDFVYVAVHEIGHALGLDHLHAFGSVMRPSVSPSEVFTTLSTTDVNAVLGLYAATPSDTTNTGGIDTGGTDTAGQGDDTSPDDRTSGDERPRGRTEDWRGRFGGYGRWRGRSGRVNVEVLTATPSRHNSAMAADVNGDQAVTALDALMIINDLNKSGPRTLGSGEGETGSSYSMLDVDGDDNVTSLDVLRVINELNGSTPVSIAIEEPIDEETMTEDDEMAEEADPPTEEAPVDDSTVNDEETEEESDGESNDETMVDEGPLEEEHEGCRGGRRDSFARLDVNEDGLLTEDEVPALLWERLLAADADEDGAISPTELEAIAREHHRPDPFAKFDANEDGALTADEVPQRVWNRLSQADADQNGAVTVAEFAVARASAGEGQSHPGRHHEEHHGRRGR